MLAMQEFRFWPFRRVHTANQPLGNARLTPIRRPLRPPVQHGLHPFQLSATGCLAAVTIVSAADPTPDKTGYHLFNPTPRPLMREMSTDRPDKTESAYTLDAGHFQIEADLFTFSHDHETRGGADTTVDAWRLGVVNLKAGLLNWMDLQFVIETYQHVTTEDRATAATVKQSGFGDIAPRLKLNVWGNDGGKTAMAIMPMVKIPTNQDALGNDSVEAALIVPFAAELPGGWNVGVMTAFGLTRNSSDDGYTTEFVNTITFGHKILGDLGGYIEFFSQVSAESDTDWIGTVDLGLTYAISEDIQLDAGVNLGVTRSAEDINPFLGLSWRF